MKGESANDIHRRHVVAGVASNAVRCWVSPFDSGWIPGGVLAGVVDVITTAVISVIVMALAGMAALVASEAKKVHTGSGPEVGASMPDEVHDALVEQGAAERPAVDAERDWK